MRTTGSPTIRLCMLTQPLPMKPKWQSNITDQAGTMARRGRPAQLPTGSSRTDRGLRMQQPGWEEQRERLNHLPQGFEPGMPSTQGSAGPAPGGSLPADRQRISAEDGHRVQTYIDR